MLPLITLDDVYRGPSDSKIFTPNILQISTAELERLDKDKDRDTRRKRRQGRLNRRGTNTTQLDVALPDLADVPKTFRIPIPSTVLPGGVDLGPPVGSYTLETVTAFKPRPPKPQPKPPSCHIIYHEPGETLLIGIKIKREELTDTSDPAFVP